MLGRVRRVRGGLCRDERGRFISCGYGRRRRGFRDLEEYEDLEDLMEFSRRRVRGSRRRGRCLRWSRGRTKCLKRAPR